MSIRFIITPSEEKAALQAISVEMGWKTESIELGAWMLGADHAPGRPTSMHSAHVGEKSLYFLGEALNAKSLAAFLCIYDSEALSLNPAVLAQIALRHLGPSALALIEGAFVAVEFDHRAQALRLFSDATGMASVHVSRSDDAPWVASSVKPLCRRFKPEFVPREQMVPPLQRTDDHSPLRNVWKLKPGAWLGLSRDGAGRVECATAPYHAFRPTQERQMPTKVAHRFLDAILGDAVLQCTEYAGRMGVPLSGGLDSSLVCALLKSTGLPLTTVSIGTDLSNEFEFAAQVASHLGTKHHEFILSNDEILQGLVESIYHNEIHDGLSAEIQAPLFALYRRCQGEIDTMITGYGSDLLFGGILDLQVPSRSANLQLWDQVYRTRWTGEFSTAGASHYGMRVRHPFWSNRLIGFCLDLSSQLKVSTAEVKLVLREYAAARELLPHNIVYRKKIGIHEGSSVNALFAGLLDTQTANYDIKSHFAHFVYRRVLEQKLEPQALDGRDLLQRFVRENARKPRVATV